MDIVWRASASCSSGMSGKGGASGIDFRRSSMWRFRIGIKILSKEKRVRRMLVDTDAQVSSISAINSHYRHDQKTDRGNFVYVV